MEDSIIFLGTGGGRHNMASQERATAGFIVQADGEQIHIDPGPGTVIMAKKFGVDLKKNTIIFASHAHIDNSNDVNVLIDVITEGGIRKKGTLICSQSVVDEILTEYHKNALTKLVVLEPGKKIKIGKLQFQAIATKKHNDCIGLKLRTQNFLLGYTADTAYSADMAKAFKGCDILIINNRIPFNKNITISMSSEDTVKLLKKVKPKLAIIQHFGRSMLSGNPMYEAREIQKQSSIQVIAATDGLKLDPQSYSAEASQKLLDSFK